MRAPLQPPWANSLSLRVDLAICLADLALWSSSCLRHIAGFWTDVFTQFGNLVFARLNPAFKVALCGGFRVI